MGDEIILGVITMSMLMVILSMVVLIAIINYKRKQEKFLQEKKLMREDFSKQLMQSQIEVQEATFADLGKELHDNVGQLLGSTKMLLGITKRSWPDYPGVLQSADESLTKAIQELRALSKTLNKEWLEQFSFIDNLNTETHRLNAYNYINISFSHTEALPLKTEEQIILFRIVQEAIQNAIKHARSKNIIIQIIEQPHLLTIIVTNDGAGFDTATTSLNGVGIMNMKHRAKLLGGSIGWQSSLEDGTTVTIKLPISQKHEN
ncbi:sensor histidine kinase [Chitinophagaceae bacterium LWZ2-11]